MCLEKAIPAGGDKPRPYAYFGLPAGKQHPVATKKDAFETQGWALCPPDLLNLWQCCAVEIKR
jgi:hypothetical protein